MALSTSQAARLIAVSREAKEQSIELIQASLRLLRQRAYPDDRLAGGPPEAEARPVARPAAKRVPWR